MRRALLFVLALTVSASALASAPNLPRGKDGKIKRSAAAVRHFKAANPCPATGKVQASCPGYIVDHKIPLCAGGADTPANMQWQTLAESRKKDVGEKIMCAHYGHG